VGCSGRVVATIRARSTPTARRMESRVASPNTARWPCSWAIPDTAKEKPQEGEVVSVGSGTINDKGEVRPLDVKAGDRILFGKWSGTEVKLDGEELLIMKESDIMGIIEGTAAAKKAA